MDFELCGMKLEVIKSTLEVYVFSGLENIQHASDKGAGAFMRFVVGESFCTAVYEENVLSKAFVDYA